MREMEVSTWHIWKKSKETIEETTDERFCVMAGAGGVLSSPPPVKPNDRGGGGCQCSR